MMIGASMQARAGFTVLVIFERLVQFRENLQVSLAG